jgi:hypothetical protein
MCESVRWRRLAQPPELDIPRRPNIGGARECPATGFRSSLFKPVAEDG